jgi:hypothetical protein
LLSFSPSLSLPLSSSSCRRRPLVVITIPLLTCHQKCWARRKKKKKEKKTNPPSSLLSSDIYGSAYCM